MHLNVEEGKREISACEHEMRVRKIFSQQLQANSISKIFHSFSPPRAEFGEGMRHKILKAFKVYKIHTHKSSLKVHNVFQKLD